MENILISNQTKLNEIKERIIKQGKDHLHVLADFDRTLTRAFYKGKKSGSLISQLRREKGKYLTLDYADKAQELFNKYHPIEIDSNILIEEKSEKMYEWWKAHIQLLIDSGFDKQTIQQSVRDMIKDNTLVLREGVEYFLNHLNHHNIPLVIMSSSLEDLIEEYMRQRGILTRNIHIIGNSFKYDRNGESVGVKRIIHVFNKNEMSLKSLLIYPELLNRKNVLLLGDSIGDIGMIEGFPYDNLLKIGFLNDYTEENLKAFRKVYDVIILNDGGFEYINEMFKGL